MEPREGPSAAVLAFAGSLSLAALLGTSCAGPVKPQRAATVERDDPAGSRSERPGYDWELQPPGERLRFSLADLESEPESPQARVVRLEDGAILAESVFHPHEYEILTCYLEFEPCETGWKPRAVGLLFGWCMGISWVNDLAGEVIVDGQDPTSLLCSVALDGTWDYKTDRKPAFRQDFRVEPRSESAELRRDLSIWFPDLPLE